MQVNRNHTHTKNKFTGSTKGKNLSIEKRSSVWAFTVYHSSEVRSLCAVQGVLKKMEETGSARNEPRSGRHKA